MSCVCMQINDHAHDLPNANACLKPRCYMNVHDLGFEPSLIWTPATITPLLCWLSTTRNAIDLAKKSFLQANREHK